MRHIDVILTLTEHNAALADTIASVAAQNLRAWRLLVLAHPAVEGVAAAINGAGVEGDDRVEVVQHAGRSVAAMRNKGLDLADAEFVAFLEPGDSLMPTALSDLIAAARAGRFGAACGSWLVADAGGTPDGPPMDPPEGALGFGELESILTIPATGAVVQRSLLEGKRFGANLTTASHTDMWLRLCEDGTRWQVLPSVVASVRHDAAGEAMGAARLDEVRSVIERSYRRASARGWEVEVLEEENEAGVVRAALFTEATRMALAGAEPDAKAASDVFAPAGDERFLTPATLGRATAVALRFSPAHRAVIDGQTERSWTPAVHAWWSRCVSQKWIAKHELDETIQSLAAELVDPRVVAGDLLAGFGAPGRLWVGGTDRTARAVIGVALDAGWRVLVLPGTSSGGVNTKLMALPSRVMVASGNETIGASDPLVIGAASERDLLERYGSRQNVARWNGAWRRAFEEYTRRLESAWPRREA